MKVKAGVVAAVLALGSIPAMAEQVVAEVGDTTVGAGLGVSTGLMVGGAAGGPLGALLQPACLLHRPAQPEPGTGTPQRAQRTTGRAADHQPGAHAQPSADCGITHFRHHLLRHCGDTAQSKYRCYHACFHLHAISPVDKCTGTYSGSMPVADLTKIKDMRR